MRAEVLRAAERADVIPETARLPFKCHFEMGVSCKVTVFLSVRVRCCSRHLSGRMLMGAACRTAQNLLAEMQTIEM